MMCFLQTASPRLPAPDRQEILRYAGARTADSDLSVLLEDVLAEGSQLLSGQVCWQVFPLSVKDSEMDLTFGTVISADLAAHLRGCNHVAVFAATLGIALDRRIARYAASAPAKALLLQAFGAERVEALCDSFCGLLQETAAADGQTTTSRFSPGYGDLPLAFQRELFRVLDCPRKIGLTLSDSLMMSPSKSVTGIIGIGSGCRKAEHNCSRCGKTDCIYRRMP